MNGSWITVMDGDSDEIPTGSKIARVTPAERKDVDFVLSQEADTGGRGS